MNLAPSILGTSTVEKLTAFSKTPVLEAGKDKFTRSDLASVTCFNFVAARLLSNALKELNVPNLKYVYDNLPPRALAVPRFGVVSLAVLGAAFEAKGLGDLESYAMKHAERSNGDDPHIVTFHTIKHHELERERKASSNARKRKRAQ